MKYMLVWRATDEALASMANTDFTKMIETVGKFNDELIRAGVLLAAEGLQPSSNGARVRFSPDGRRTVVDGPFAEAKEMVGGFFLIDVPTRAEALAIARECPAAEWATVEVRETGPCYT